MISNNVNGDVDAAFDRDGAAPQVGGTEVFVTGFGPFATVKVNPSSTVGKHVAEGLKRRGDLAAVHFDELETSVVATSAYFDALEKRIEDALRADPTRKFLLFHVGVHSGEKAGIMRVETVGYNELHASVPDVRGVVFNHDVIDAADGDTTAQLVSVFAQAGSSADKSARDSRLQGIVAEINRQNAERARSRPKFALNPTAAHFTEPVGAPGAGGAPAHPPSERMVMPEFLQAEWTISENAGRYLCNYCLYRSLQLQVKFSRPATEGGDNAKEDGDHPAAQPVSSVFIHVCDPTLGATAEILAAMAKTAPSTAGDNPQATREQTQDGGIVKYNPTVMEQGHQTEELAHRLVEWIQE